MNLDMTDSMGPGKLVRHMQNPSYTYDKYLICMGLGPSILSVIDESPSYSGPSYPSSPVVMKISKQSEAKTLDHLAIRADCDCVCGDRPGLCLHPGHLFCVY